MLVLTIVACGLFCYFLCKGEHHSFTGDDALQNACIILLGVIIFFCICLIV